MQEVLDKILKTLERGVQQPSLVAIFTVLSVVQALMAVIAWATSSGYEDSSVPYVLQFLIAILTMGVLAAIAWRSTARD